MGFLIRFFAITVAVLFGRGAYAQCCWCDTDPCPFGQEFGGYNNGVPNCDNPCYGYDCDYCDDEPGQYCDSFPDPCPGLASNYKCKVKSGMCGASSGCTGYQSCDSQTGILGPDVVSENCHLENSTCYVNTRNCSNFAIDVSYDAFTCDQNAQTGQAQWNTAHQAWDTVNCTCRVTDRDVRQTNSVPAEMVYCRKFNAWYYVSAENRYWTSSVNDSVLYSQERSWCAQCYEGKLPAPESAQLYGAWQRPDNNGTWGAWRCNQDVAQPYYADGCVIDFGLSSGSAAVSACQMSCPGGMTITEDGATGISQCVPTGLVYEDATGTFVIGSDLCH